MRTFLHVVILLAVSQLALAQQNTPAGNFTRKAPPTPFQIRPSTAVSPLKEYIKSHTEKRADMRWMNYALDYAAITTLDPTYSLMRIFPDTNIVDGIKDGITYVPLYHAAATVIDPSKFIYDPWFSDHYFLDSLRFSFAYLRHTEQDIVDTVQISIFKPRILFWGTIGIKKVYWRAVGYDAIKNQIDENGLNDTSVHVVKYKFTLRFNDASQELPTGVTISDFIFPVEGIPEQGGEEVIGACIEFIPGYEYSYGNGLTLIDDMNSFYLYSSEENGMESTPDYNDSANYNFSYVLTTEVRYDDTSSAFRHQFFPSVGYESKFLFENHLIYFHISDELITGAKDLMISNNLNFYPNPVKESATLSYSLQNTVKNVSLRIFDLTGKEIQRQDEGTKTPGEHQLQVSLDNLPKGMYLYSFHADGEKSMNGRFVID